MCVAGVDAVMAMAASLDRDSLWGTGDVSYCSRRQEVRICPGEGEMVCIWDEVSVFGITVTIVHGISPPPPAPCCTGLTVHKTFCLCCLCDCHGNPIRKAGQAGSFRTSEMGRLRHGEERCPMENQCESRAGDLLVCCPTSDRSSVPSQTQRYL